MTPKLTIVTACYNHAQYLRECIASVRRQTVYDIEHIIVIDAATDDSLKIAYDAMDDDVRVLVIRNSENRGLAASLNKAVAIATAPWIMKVDADDKIATTYVEQILWAAEKDQTRNIIFSPAQHFGTRTDVYTYPPFEPHRMLETLMLSGCAAIRRDVLDAVGGYDETMRFAEDWDLHIRAQLAVGLVPHQLAEPLWSYRKHGPSASTAGVAALPELRRYWKGHTRESSLSRSRNWGDWCCDELSRESQALGLYT